MFRVSGPQGLVFWVSRSHGLVFRVSGPQGLAWLVSSAWYYGAIVLCIGASEEKY